MPGARAPERRPHGSPLLLGGWTPIVRDPIDLIRASFLAGAIVAAAGGHWESALRLALTFGGTVVARLIDLPRPFDLAFNVGMAAQAWGNVLGAFQHVYGYDKVVHFALPAAMATMLYLVAIRLGILPDLAAETGIHQRVGIVLVAFCMGMTVGAGYEVYEWFADHVLGAKLQVGYGDTIGDLVDDAAGSLLGGALLVVWDVYGWGTRRRLPGEVVTSRRS